MDNHIAASGGISAFLQVVEARALDMDPGLDADRQRACRCQRNENARRTKTAGILVTLLRHGNLLRAINVC
ncbi:hypothetical protein [Paracoccus sp. SY]|uniref:hypothetical protein n=1 Tax=Paracoccus sp. SY TaxID=1330255 RepID=UPI0011AFAB44|nr:hypothetical protein [Paracoccus sp. SY]